MIKFEQSFKNLIIIVVKFYSFRLYRMISDFSKTLILIIVTKENLYKHCIIITM